MRRTIRWAIVACITLVTLPVAPASAEVLDRDTGFDPQDIEHIPGINAPDIRSTTRRLAQDHGRRVLAIIVRFYDPDGGLPTSVRIDANGGPSVDHLMWIQVNGCAVWPKGRRSDSVVGRAAARGAREVCRVPGRAVAASKPIRWKVRTEPPDGSRRGDTFEIDHAPNGRRWYV